MTDQIDFTMMYAIHDALRRDLGDLAHSAAAAGDDPARLSATHFGWGLFKSFLTLHHGTEDAVLWPRMRELAAGDSEDLGLIDAMEAEHSRIDPLIAAVEEALADAEHGHERLGAVTDELAYQLGAHLSHEETDGLPLVGRRLPVEDWLRFGDEQRSRVGLDEASKYLPWLLDGATEERTAGVLQFIPPHLQELYRTAWRGAYVEANPWAGERRTV